MKISASTDRKTRMSPILRARLAGATYLIVYIAGTISLLAGSVAAGLIAGLCYIAVTIFFYYIFEPVSRKLSLVAALVSLTGCVFGVLDSLQLSPLPLNTLVFFGVYCLLIGYLVFRSTFLPKFLGVLMVIGGIGWLTFISPQLAGTLAPYNFAPGMIGEGVLTLWLLIIGVNEQRLNDLAGDNIHRIA